MFSVMIRQWAVIFCIWKKNSKTNSSVYCLDVLGKVKPKQTKPPNSTLSSSTVILKTTFFHKEKKRKTVCPISSTLVEGYSVAGGESAIPLWRGKLLFSSTVRKFLCSESHFIG